MATRVRMTKQQHLLIFLKSTDRPEWTYNELAEWARVEFSLLKSPGKSTIMDIVKTQSKLSSLSADCPSKQRLRPPHMLRLNEAVVEFVIDVELSKTPVSGREIIRVSARLANELAIPKRNRPQFARAGWLRRFLARHNFRHKRAHGEIGSVNVGEALKHVGLFRQRIGQYHPANVYNMDETALFYKAVPRTSVCLKQAPALKLDKARITMVVAANTDGTDKLPLVFLGKSECPRWLSKKPDGVEYVGTSKGWMTAAVYQQWLRELNARIEKGQRYILLLVDNVPSHIDRGLSRSNVTIVKLPPNTTSMLQPMDQGVIASLKRGYMSLKTEEAVERFLDGDKDPYHITLLEGIEMCQESWLCVQTSMIKNY